MEWKVFSLTEVDGISGYQMTGYMDGYRGNPDHDLDDLFIPSSDFYWMTNLYEAYSNKIRYYKSLEDSSSHILERLLSIEIKNVELYNKIYAIKEFNGELDE